MFLGRFKLGQWVHVPYEAKSSVGAPSQPALPPIIDFYTAAGVKVASGLVPPLDGVGEVGLFSYAQQLTSEFAAGHYAAHVTSGTLPVRLWHFQILPGGNVDGAVLSMTFFPRPEAAFVVGKLDSGKRFIARNPVEI